MKTGAFIVPTGIGASIGGFAGDASKWARKFASKYKLIVNPNVVNAACFSGMMQVPCPGKQKVVVFLFKAYSQLVSKSSHISDVLTPLSE